MQTCITKTVIIVDCGLEMPQDHLFGSDFGFPGCLHMAFCSPFYNRDPVQKPALHKSLPKNIQK
jgi:hypothetical protein